MRRRWVWLSCVIVLLAATVRFALAQDESAYVVIVNPNNPERSLDRKLLSDIFLKKVTRWPDGEACRPVDQRPSSSVRRRFSNDVHRRSVAAVRSYWQQQIFSGRDVPPPELESDVEVIRYVRRHRGAVGYVSARADLEGTRVVRVE